MGAKRDRGSRRHRSGVAPRHASLARSLEALEPRLLLSAADWLTFGQIQLPPHAAGAPEAVQALVQSITSTRSDAPIFTTGELVQGSEQDIEPNLVQSNALIGLPSFRSHADFAGIDGSGFSIVIIDTGIDLDHPFFGPDSDGDGVADRIVYHYDFADGDADASDVNGHGSNVASIALSQNADAKGMAPGANIIALKVFTNAGSGTFAYVEQALQWVVANAATYNIAAVNMSLGDNANWGVSRPLYGIGDELAALTAMDVITVASTGNSFYSFSSVTGVAYPAADANVLAVGAVFDANLGSVNYANGAAAYSSVADAIAPFSQRHATLTDIFAPGAAITGANQSGGTVTYHGTSQAAPHITGVAALAQQLAVRDLGRRLTTSEFAALLQSTGVIVNDGDNENDNVTNTGLNFQRVDVLALGNAILDMADTGPNRPATPDLAAESDTGSSSTDDLTRLNNAAPAAALSFSVGDTIAGALVELLAGEVVVGSAIAEGMTTTILTDGATVLADGTHPITARQTVAGVTSRDSAALEVTIDTTAPVAAIGPVTPDPRTTPVDQVTIAFTEIVVGLALSDLILTRDGVPGSLSAASLTSIDGGQNWTLGGLAAVTAGPGDYLLTLADAAATDLAGNAAATASQAWTVYVDQPPVIWSLTPSINPVPQGTLVTLIADVSDDGTVQRVDFYRDSNGNGVWDPPDLLMGSDINGDNGWSRTFTAGPQTLTYTYFAVAFDDVGQGSEPVATTITVLPAPTAPTIGQLVATPSPVLAGQTFTLTALGVVEGAQPVRQVRFYRDANNNGVWEPVPADMLAGIDSFGEDGWSATVSTVPLGPGVYTFFAMAEDLSARWSAPVAVTVHVTERPVIGGLTVEPDPVQRGSDAELIATDVSDPDGTVQRVEFYRDADGDGVLDPELDELLGSDGNGTDGWSALFSTAGLGGGIHTYFARALDNLGAWSEVRSVSGVVLDQPVTVALSASPDPVQFGTPVTLTALVSDDQRVQRVEFYRDSNGNGVLNAGLDELLGSDSNGGDGWSVTFTAASSQPYTYSYFARALDNTGQWSEVATTTITILPRPLAPTIGQLVATPNPVAPGQAFTLTALDVVGGELPVQQVSFFRDFNGNGVLDPVPMDRSAGTDFSGEDGWSVSVSTVPLGAGDHTFFAAARNYLGWWSAPVAVTVYVTDLPIIGELSANPDPVMRGLDLELIASGVGVAAGAVQRVEFYRDADGDGVLDPELDELLGSDASGSDGWSARVSTVSFAEGAQTYFARAQDDAGAWSEVRSVTGVISPNPSPILALTATPNPVTATTPVTLTAVVNENRPVQRVEFYRDSNGNGVFDPGIDALLSADTDGADGWSATFLAMAQPMAYIYFARALDDTGQWSEPIATTVTVVPLATAPTIGELVATPDPVVRGQFLTLTALDVNDSNGNLIRVQFYHDRNGNGILEQVDVGVGIPSLDELWSVKVSTASLAPGTHTFFALAQGDFARWSGPASVTVTVNERPVIGSLTVAPDPVRRGEDAELFAWDVSDSDGTVQRLEFYRDADGDGVLNADLDELLGSDSSGGDGWSVQFSTAAFAAGTHTYFARALDDLGGWSNVRSVTATVLPVLLVSTPVLAATSDSGISDSDGLTNVTTPTFTGAATAEATVTLYANGVAVGNGVAGDGAYSITTTALADGVYAITAHVDDGYGSTTSAALTVTLDTAAPTAAIGEVHPATGPVDRISLSFDAPVTGFDLSDLVLTRQGAPVPLLGATLYSSDNYNWELRDLAASTSQAGAYVLTIVAAGSDIADHAGNALVADASMAFTVVLPPTIASLTVNPDPVSQGANLKLTANNVSGGSASIANVEFYRDVNGDGLLDPATDELLGVDTKAAGGWAINVSTSDFPEGTNTFFTRARNSLGLYSDVQSATTVVQVPSGGGDNQAPTIASLTVSPDPVTTGKNLTLTAYNVVDADGTIARVNFYRDINGNGVLDLGIDQLLGMDAKAAGGWAISVSTTGWDAGDYTYFALALDNGGAWSDPVATTGTVLEDSGDGGGGKGGGNGKGGKNSTTDTQIATLDTLQTLRLAEPSSLELATAPDADAWAGVRGGNEQGSLASLLRRGARHWTLTPVG